MSEYRLQISNLGPISEANLQFGDLTIFTGPQASGKSIALQMLKLAVDLPIIRTNLSDQGLVWSTDDVQFFDLYLGEGMRSVWRKGSTSIKWGNETQSIRHITRRSTPVGGPVLGSAPLHEFEKVAYIPAQRVMSLRDGFTRPFGEYRAGDPYVLRDFSHNVHLTVQSELTHKKSDKLFPKSQRFNSALRSLVEKDVLGGWALSVSATALQKEFVLTPPKTGGGNQEDEPLKFLAWSAGQREFIPLLLGLYRLLPAGAIGRRDSLEWAIIEEPESGLHPRAIAGFMAFVFELLRRRYKVVISTHSPSVLDVVWGIRTLKQYGGTPKDLARMVAANPSREISEAARVALDSDTRVYYFERNAGAVDISRLDPDSEIVEEAGWGGLTAFSDSVATVVTDVVQRYESGGVDDIGSE